MDEKASPASRLMDLAIEGEINIYRAREIRQHLLAAMQGSAAPIECDLSGVSELDTTGFQLLVQLKRECTAAGRELRLKRHSDAVLEVLSLYCAEQYFGDPLVLQAEDEDASTAIHNGDPVR